MKTSAVHPFKFLVALRAVLSALVMLAISSCNSLNKNDGGYTEYTGGPAKYPSDGSYHPYKPGEAPPARSTTHYQEYAQSGGASSPGYESQPKKRTSTSSSKTSAAKKKKKPSADNDNAAPAKSKTAAKSTGGGQTHIVKHGDTFYGLAKKYHTTVTALKKTNNRTSDILRDGEKIKIP